MDRPPPITDTVFAAFLHCPLKAYLKHQGVPGEPSDFEATQARRAAEYRTAARDELWRRQGGEAPAPGDAPSVPDALREGLPLLTDVAVADAGQSCRFDALEREPAQGAAPELYRPVLFARHDKVTAVDRLLLAFGASVLARVQGGMPASGKVIHGSDFRAARVKLATVSAEVQETVGRITALRDAPNPPPVRLNRHCPECEFRARCRAEAVAKDDLSLLRGLSAKQIAALHARGIFTVTQFSHTFRPGRMKRAAEVATPKHDHALQALAVREKTVYVARRPELPAARVQAYLDVEGLPEEDFYYLVGLDWTEGDANHRLSLWADRQGDEAAVWAAFLQVVAGWGEDFALFHYGSYEARFVEKMGARHGGDPALIARLKARGVNVLSLIDGRVYFPAHGNDLKGVAGCLGFRWSAPEPSGLQTVAWRYGWEATGDESLKGLLLTYNAEDRAALARVVEVLRSLRGDLPRPSDSSAPPVAGVEGLEGGCRHRYGIRRRRWAARS